MPAISPLDGVMELFVDSSSPAVIEYWFIRGATGVTTNPSIIAQELQLEPSTAQERVLNHLRQLVVMVKPRPISIQTTSEDPRVIIAQAQQYRSLFTGPGTNNVVVKVPFSSKKGTDLLPVVRELADQNIPVNVTCISLEDQMYLAIMNGARYVSPFIGRMEQLGVKPLPILRRVRRLIDEEHLPVQIICGSIRQTSQIIKCWDGGRGAHIVTVPPKVLNQFGQSDLTVATTQEMLANAAEAGLT